MTLSISLAETQFSPGAVLAADVGWDAAPPAGEIRLTLLWYTDGKGDEDVGIVARQALPASESRGRLPFRFQLPAFPWSFSGGLISLVWALEASGGGSSVERVSFILAPGGEEIRLRPPVPPVRSA